MESRAVLLQARRLACLLAQVPQAAQSCWQGTHPGRNLRGAGSHRWTASSFAAK